MRKTKFWLVQIVMLILVSLVFGSAAFAGPPDHSKGKGAAKSYTAHNNHSGGHAQGGYHANGNAAFMGTSVPDPDPDPDPEPDPIDPAQDCLDSGGTWYNGVCY